MKIVFFVLIGIAFFACNNTSHVATEKNNLITELIENIEPQTGVCPKNHTDSIIPIIYGFPTQESFQKSDSGLVYLGGCDLVENAPTWYCKIHDLTF